GSSAACGLLLLVVVLFRWRPRPPRTTLVPYTPLFRSQADRVDRPPPGGSPDQARAGIPAGVPRCGLCLFGRAEGRPHLDRSAREDRKSTRLNSSHVKISYAVFCLKKTKRTTRRDDQPT